MRQQLFLIVTSLFINLPTSWGHWFLQGSCHRNTTPPLTSPTPLVFCAVARYCWTVVGPLYRPVSCLPIDCTPLKSQMGQHKKEIVISVSHSSIWMHRCTFLINCVFAKSAGIWNVDFNKCFLRVNNQFLIWNSIHVNIKHMYLRSRAKTLQNRKTSFTLSHYSKIIYIF